MRTVDVIAHILRREGVDYLSAFPTSTLIEAAAESGIRPVICRQERVGVGIADGYSRVNNGRPPGVFAMQFGPGAENAYAGVATAFSDAVPMLLLPLGHPRDRDGIFPHYSSLRSYASVTKQIEQISVPERVVEKCRALVSIEPNSLQHADSEQLHRLRIECKKLRYLLDCFIIALPDLPVRDVLKQLKRVQRTLGRIQDISVQSALIQEFSTTGGGFAFHENGTRPALEVLLTSLTSERQALQQQVVEEFQVLTVVVDPMILPLSDPDRVEIAGPQDQQDQQEPA